MEIEETITDPSNRKVFLPWDAQSEGVNLDLYAKLYSQYQDVVSMPACTIEMPDQRIFYFKSIDFGFTISVEVIRDGEIWRAVSYSKNPSVEVISLLLNKGNFVAGKSMSHALK
jgi:hypothetical protein